MKYVTQFKDNEGQDELKKLIEKEMKVGYVAVGILIIIYIAGDLIVYIVSAHDKEMNVGLWLSVVHVLILLSLYLFVMTNLKAQMKDLI